MGEAGRGGMSHTMLAAVNLIKEVGCVHFRNNTGIRNKEGTLKNNEKEKMPVFTQNFERCTIMQKSRLLLQFFELNTEHSYF